MADGSEKARFLGECARVGDYGGGVHLQTVVVVKSEWLVADDARIEPEAALLQFLARARMAAVEDRHVVLFRDGVDGVEEAEEVLLRVDVLLAVGREKDVFPFFESETLVDVAGLDVSKVLMEHFGHRRTGDVGALLGQSAVGEVAARMLRVAQIDVGDDVYDPAVGLFGEAFVLASVAGLHVEDGYMEALGGDCGETRVCVSEDEQCVGLRGGHQLVGAVDDVAYGGAQIVADRIHVYLRIRELQVAEEYAVEVVVVVLAGMGEDYVEVSAAFIDGGRKTDDFGARADDDQQLEAAVVGEAYFRVVGFQFIKL